MLNSAIILSATKSQAEKIVKQANVDDSARIRKLYMTCYGRPANDAEVTKSLQFLARFQAVYATSKDPRLKAWQSLCKAIIASNEFIYVE
jgi:hypothetical protein